MTTDTTFTAQQEMTIRKPVQEVFKAFVDPEVTEHFWFSKGSAPLEQGVEVEWNWEMYDLTLKVHVKVVEENKRIVFDWGNKGRVSTVQLTFRPIGGSNTFVTATNYGFEGNTNEKIEAVKDSSGGFAFVLSGLKAYLEHGIDLRSVNDRSPDNL